MSIIETIRELPGKIFASNTSIVIVALVLIAVGYYVYTSNPQLLGLQSPAKETDDSTKSLDKIVFFYATWCPACASVKPAWEQAKKECDVMEFTEIDCSDQENSDTAALIEKYSIAELPTFIIIKENGAIIPFNYPENEPITTDHLIQFAQENA